MSRVSTFTIPPNAEEPYSDEPAPFTISTRCTSWSGTRSQLMPPRSPWFQPKAPGAVGQRSQVRPGRPNPRVLNRSACRVCDGAGDDCSLAGERLRPEQDERPRPRCGPSPPVEEREWECGTDGPQRNGGAGK